MRIAIGIATRGRAAILGEVLAELRLQSRAPDRIIICHVTPDDVTGLADRFPAVEFLQSPAGLPRQRNAILDAATDCDAVLPVSPAGKPARRRPARAQVSPRLRTGGRSSSSG